MLNLGRFKVDGTGVSSAGSVLAPLVESSLPQFLHPVL